MAAPTVYRWDDTDAPVMRGEATSMIEVLTACLVTGYGSKPAAGWTKEFVNAENTKAVFRNDSVIGTGFYLQVDSTASAVHAYVQAYETMSDVDTGLGPITDIGYLHASQYANTDPRAWIVIADARCFYIFNCTDQTIEAMTYMSQNCFFGDVHSLFDPDPYGYVVCYSSNYMNRGENMVRSTTNASESSTYIARSRSGATGIFGAATFFGGPAPVLAGTGGRDIGVDYPAIIVPIGINDAEAYTMRGYMPGLYCPCHTFPFTHLEQPVIDGIQFIAVTTRNLLTSVQCLVALDTNFRP